MNVLRMAMAAAMVLTAGVALAADDDFVMGNYEGEFYSQGESIPARAQVVNRGYEYQIFVYMTPPESYEELRLEISGKRRHQPEGTRDKDRIIDVAGIVDVDGEYTLVGTIEDQILEGDFDGPNYGSFELERVFIKSPTLGMAPPEGAIVLMDGTNLDAWHTPPFWTMDGEGNAYMQKGSLQTKEEFGSGHYHIEFRCPFMPWDNGQARGNSGVYIQGRYEIQVLDSFADIPAENLCGGIYSIATPDVPVTASLPPLQWQTYDFYYTAPEFDDAGNKTKNAVITVKHNGVTIHDKVEFPKCGPGGVSGEEAPVGVLLFQNHGNDVRYRNVWYSPAE